MMSHTILSREQWLPVEHFSQDTSHAPNVNGLGILLEREHDFRSTVPSSGDVFGHEAGIVLGRSGRTCESKVADFEIAIGIQKKIRGLEVTMEDVCGVHGLQGTESLVNEVLAMVVRELLSSNDTVHIRLHEFLHYVSLYAPPQAKTACAHLDEIDFGEGLVIARFLDIQNGDDVLVVEVPEQLHFTERSQTEHGMVERGDLLDGHLLAGRLV